MKKYLCILLAFALVLTLAACGGDPSSDLPDPDVEDTGEVSDGATPTDLDAPTAEPTPTPVPEDITTLKVCGISVIKNGQLTNLAYKGVKYENGVLTLDAAVLDSGHDLGHPHRVLRRRSRHRRHRRVRVHVLRCARRQGRRQRHHPGRGQPLHNQHRIGGYQRRGRRHRLLRAQGHRRAAVESTGVTAGEGFSLSENSETSLVAAAA